jgi:hypothetical protein
VNKVENQLEKFDRFVQLVVVLIVLTRSKLVLSTEAPPLEMCLYYVSLKVNSDDILNVLKKILSYNMF